MQQSLTVYLKATVANCDLELGLSFTAGTPWNHSVFGSAVLQNSIIKGKCALSPGEFGATRSTSMSKLGTWSTSRQ